MLFSTEDVTNAPTSKSSKVSPADDDVDVDEAVDLITLAGGATPLIQLIAASGAAGGSDDEAGGGGDGDDAGDGRYLLNLDFPGDIGIGNPNSTICQDIADIICKNDQNKTILGAVPTDNFAVFLNSTTPCYIPGIRGRPGLMTACNAMALSFDAVINLDSCVSVWELLKRAIQAKKAQRQRNKGKA